MDKDKSLDMENVQTPEAVWAQVCSEHDPDEEALLFLAPEYFAMHSTIYIAQAEPDSDTRGNFTGKEGVGHARGAYLLEGNHLKSRITIRTLLVRSALLCSASKQFEQPEGR